MVNHGTIIALELCHDSRLFDGKSSFASLCYCEHVIKFD